MCLEMHANMETGEHKQGANSEKEWKKDKVGRNTWYIIGRNTSDKDNVVMKAEDE